MRAKVRKGRSDQYFSAALSASDMLNNFQVWQSKRPSPPPDDIVGLPFWVGRTQRLHTRKSELILCGVCVWEVVVICYHASGTHWESRDSPPCFKGGGGEVSRDEQ